MKETTRYFQAHIALACAAIIYGANYIIAKSVIPNPIDPNSFIVLRVLGSCLLFWLLWNRRIKIPDRADWGRFVLCAVCGVATNQLLFFNGLALTSPINAAIIMTSNPIMVMLISAVLLRSKITWIKVVGIALGAIGAISLLLLSKFDLSRMSSWQGDLCILINSLAWAFYLVLVKPLLRKYDAMMVTAWVFLIGVFLVLPFGGKTVVSLPWATLSAWQWFSIFYVVVFVTFFAYLLNMFAIHHSTPTLASSYIYFQPLLAGIFAWIATFFMDRDFTGDITWVKVGCAALIFLGVYLVSRSERAGGNQSNWRGNSKKGRNIA